MKRLLSIAALTLLASQAAAQESCKLTGLGTAQVAAVGDGRTLLLADGREVRLAGLEVTDSSRAALQRLIGGSPVRLEALSPEFDRCGRVVAFGFAGDARQSPHWCCWSRDRRGWRRGPAARPAPRRFWRPNGPPARAPAGCGPIPISPF